MLNFFDAEVFSSVLSQFGLNPADRPIKHVKLKLFEQYIPVLLFVMPSVRWM